MTAPLVGWMILVHHPWVWWTFFWISWTDAADGWLARKLGVESRLGAYLDPLGDKVWVLSATVAQFYVDKIPFWLLVLILGRDALILAGSAVVYRVTGEKDFPPTMLGKLSTVIQLTMLAGCFTMAPGPLEWMWWLAAAGTAVSGIDYVRQGVRMVRGRTLA